MGWLLGVLSQPGSHSLLPSPITGRGCLMSPSAAGCPCHAPHHCPAPRDARVGLGWMEKDPSRLPKPILSCTSDRSGDTELAEEN